MAERKINGINIYYETYGEGEPLVLIMGLRRNLEWWYRQVPELSSQYKVVAFDNRGAGRSDKPVMPYSIRLFANDTAALIDSLKLGKVHVMGISMGGYIAQELAINYPDRVRSLILGCTGPGGINAPVMTPERTKKFTANEGLSPEEILKKDMDIYFSDRFITDNPDRIEEFTKISMRWYQPPDAFLRQFEACRKHDTTDRLHQVRVPTLILSGDDDPLIPGENSRMLKITMPHADIHFFPNLRHVFFIEAYEAVNRKILNFLASC